MSVLVIVHVGCTRLTVRSFWSIDEISRNYAWVHSRSQKLRLLSRAQIPLLRQCSLFWQRVSD